MSAERRAIRVLAMQTLCQWDVQHDETDGACGAVAEVVEAPARVAFEATELARRYWRDRASIDARIAAEARHWDMQRLTIVDRNVLRVAVTEMLSGEVPPKVAIDEAIEVVKVYGGADSPRFVNGVLDAAYRRIQQETQSAPPTNGGAAA